MATHTVTDDGSGRKYWTQIPNIVFDLGLRPFPVSLYCQFKRIVGGGGQCDETTRQLAARLGCSAMAISKALEELATTRVELSGKALVKVAKVADGKGTRKARIAVTLTDIWPENMARYGGQAVSTVDGAVHIVYGAVNTVDGGRKHSVHPKEPGKNEEQDIAASTDDAPDAADPTPPETLVEAGPANPNGTATQAEPNGTGKPKPRKSSAPRVPLGPGSLVYRDAVHLTPNHAQREILDAAHAAHGEPAMRAVMVAWLAHGYSPKNVAGMVEAINAGGLRTNGAGGRANGKPLSAMVLEI